jgi:uncharacterized protein with GYD domain
VATFVSTVKFTDRGMGTIQETTKRAADFQSVAAKMGAEVKQIYWTFGVFDGLLIFEAPDEESATALLLHLGAQGHVHTTTARAFNSSEMDQVLAKMSAGS